jgi:hypothetical protein
MDFADGAGEEGATADDVHDRAQQGRYPAGAGDLGYFVAEQHGEHGRECDDRDGDDQVDPEELPKLSNMVGAVAGMTPVVSMVVAVGVGFVNGVLAVAVVVGVNAGGRCR